MPGAETAIKRSTGHASETEEVKVRAATNNDLQRSNNVGPIHALASAAGLGGRLLLFYSVECGLKSRLPR